MSPHRLATRTADRDRTFYRREDGTAFYVQRGEKYHVEDYAEVNGYTDWEPVEQRPKLATL